MVCTKRTNSTELTCNMSMQFSSFQLHCTDSTEGTISVGWNIVVRMKAGCSVMSACCTASPSVRVPTPPRKSWIFFLKIPGPGKSRKIASVMESPGNISLKVVHFSSGSNGKEAAVQFILPSVQSVFSLFPSLGMCL